MLNILELSDYGNMHIVVFIINILLFVFSKKIVYLLNNNKENERQLSFFRILNVLFFIFHFLDLALLFFRFNHENIFFNFALTFMYLYFGIMIYNLVTFFTRKKFGISKCIDDKVIYYDSYSSRMVYSVREGERILLDGLPWKIQKINMYCIFVNPVADLNMRVQSNSGV